MSNYIFSIGGNGALCTEALVHLCAAGLGPEELTIFFIDPDINNKNLKNLFDLLDLYDSIRETLSDTDNIGFFKTQIKYKDDQGNYSVWNPNDSDRKTLSEGISLTDFSTYPSITKYKLLVEALYNDNQINDNLELGYKGNPMIGSIFLPNFKNSVLFQSINFENNSKVFVFGSIFGGTGASGLPIIPKIIKERNNRIKVGSCMLFPYFSILKKAENDDHLLRPDSSKFLASTKMAIPYYIDGNSEYDKMYMIGCDKSLDRLKRKEAIGGAEQENTSHFLNLFAAKSSLHFFSERSNNSNQFLLTYVKDGNEITISDLHNDTIPAKGYHLEKFYFASLYFHKYFLKYLKEDKNKLVWFQKNFNTSLDNETLKNCFGKYFENYLKWLGQMGKNEIPLKLFDISYYQERDETQNRIEQVIYENYSDDRIGNFILNSGNEPKQKGFITKSFYTFDDANKNFVNHLNPKLPMNDFKKMLWFHEKGGEEFIQKIYDYKNVR